ncbi:hypothetical protein DFH06DRAFT_1296614 [Mycena polygramma]|nr:hypothetical protein DFH06DRAFT_1296614 [Mycena polygramma]
MIGSLSLSLPHHHIPTFLYPTSYPVHPHPMAHITTALGSFSRLFLPSPAPALGLSHSKSDPDLALAQQIDTHLRPASSTSVRPRPASAMAIEGGWDAERGTTLRRQTRMTPGHCVAGLRAPADVKVTDSSLVLASSCRPARTPLPIADIHADTAAAADVVYALERHDANALLPAYTLERRDTTAADSSLSQLDISLIADASASSDSSSDGDISFTLPPALALLPAYTLDRRDSEPDLSFDLSLDLSLDVSLVSETSTSSADDSADDSEGDISFTRPPPALEHRVDCSFDISLDISLISDTSTSADESYDIPFSVPPPFSLPSPPSASGHATTPSKAVKPIGLGITNLFNHDGVPFDGMGVLSFGCRGASTSHCDAHPASRDGLSRTFLEEAAWTWAADPEHLRLTVISEEWDEGEEPKVSVWAGEDAECETDKRRGRSKSSRTRIEDTLHKAQNRTTTRDSSTHGHGVERDTISSGLKRTRRAQAASASVTPGGGAQRGVWRA